MIRELCDHIDQLDLALDQLALKDRNFDRFAIMLVDNVVELALHQYARHKKLFGSRWFDDTESRVNDRVLEAALGQDFDAKVTLALQTGLITAPWSRSINWLHSFRNSSYHAGLRHEGILHSLANFYLVTCCDLLVAYKPSSWSYGSQQTISHRAAKYLGHTDGLRMLFDAAELFEAAWKRIRVVAVNMKCNMIADLVRDMSRTIDEADEQIKFVSTNSPRRGEYSRRQVVIDAQVWPLAFSVEGVEYARKNGYTGRLVQGPALATWLEGNFRGPSTVDPIPGWKRRLRSLSEEKDEHAALDKYCNFIRQTQALRDALSDQEARLDQYIQEQVDIMRGK
ncbi:hypothetical protein [Stenotrophomonas muris]|uniref:hypothetical protein n=1 Tax=Stenotrophomonas muris TaxID=2963283 RepID=UPI0005A4A4AB